MTIPYATQICLPTTIDKPSVLSSLRLSAEHLRALALQGSVAAEYRGTQGPYYKLYFRCSGRQVVRYLGKDPEIAEQLCQELRKLQAPVRHFRELNRLSMKGRQVIRETKQWLLPTIAAAGLKFHGLAIRRPRRVTLSTAPQTASL